MEALAAALVDASTVYEKIESISLPVHRKALER